MGLIVFNPTSGPSLKELHMAKRGQKLENSIVGLIDNGKKNSDTILQYIGKQLKDLYKVKDVRIVKKASFSHAIEEAEARMLAEKCDFIIAGIGD